MTQPLAFQFVAPSYLTRVHNQRAASLTELRDGLDQASDGSVFYHTFQTLGRRPFLSESFSNDFAQWVLAALNRPKLAERLAGLDIRDYVSIADLRGDLRRLLADYCAQHPHQAEQCAFEPFYFCESIEVTVPLELHARTLAGFRESLLKLSHASLFYHFISSRLRLHLTTNDFSHWLETALGLDGLARRINRIDIYTNTLDTAREKILELIDGEINREMNHDMNQRETRQ